MIRCLLTYSDWAQPATGSIIQVGAARRANGAGDGFRQGLIETLDEREELRRRVWRLEDRARRVLFLWYMQQLEVQDIARAVRVSRRHVFRLRSQAVQRIVELGEPERAA